MCLKPGAFAFLLLVALLPAAASAQDAPATPEVDLASGLELEQERQWSDAIRHYESALRRWPENGALSQRLVISRLHYDVHRRLHDASYVRSLQKLSTQEALDLYAEALENIEAHYVDPPDWRKLLVHGTASLEVALSDPAFIKRTLPDVPAERVEHFRQSVHKQALARSAGSRYDLRANVAYVAGLARQEIGLAGTATVMEYLCGAILTLDPYSRFLTGDQLDDTFSNIEGNFVGLGIELKAEADRLRIVSVIADGPADRAGLKAGEMIVQVESARVGADNGDQVADQLRGVEGSWVTLHVLDREERERALRVQRRRVEVPCVENVHIADEAAGVGYLRLTNFQKTTIRDVERALWDLHRQGMRMLVIDVRGNPGGLLSAAVEVADRFLDSGRIVSTRGRNARENFDYVAHRNNTWSVPLIVLVDHDSASASEIFAGAIHDNRRGTLVGQTTYGKGSVQGIFRLRSSHAGLCLTTAKFYSPSGQAISDHGVAPELTVEPTVIAARPTEDGRIATDADDAVLQRALLHARGNVLASRVAK